MGQTVVYVDGSAFGANEGSSWLDAFTDLQSALDLARTDPSSPREIWVAQGTYRPDRGAGDPRESFRLVDATAIYGGFGGWEVCRDERAIDRHPTILDGDLLGNDSDDAVSVSDCCTWEGGAGCDDDECESLVVAVFPWCLTDWDLACAYSSTALCRELCSPTRGDNSFNVLTATNLQTGATLDGLTITHGEASCLENGPCSYSGGLAADHSVVTLQNCTFIGNAGFEASAVFSQFGVLNVRQSRFFAQRRLATAVPFAVEAWQTDTEVCDSLFEGLQSAALGFNGNHAAVERTTFRNNAIRGLVINSISATVRDCLFLSNGNSVDSPATLYNSGSTLLSRCKFLGNVGTSSGAAVDNHGALALVNCVFVGNQAGQVVGGGAAVLNSAGGATLVNCSIIGNSAGSGGAGISNVGSISMLGCNIWGNWTATWGYGERSQFSDNSSSTPTFLYNNVQGWTGTYGGEGNIDVDPGLIDADGPDDVVGTLDDNLRLRFDSPLIDAGHPNPPTVPYIDADGHARVLYGRVDIGAYEFGIGDFDGNRYFALADFANWWWCVTGPDIEPYVPVCAAFDFHGELGDDGDHLDLRDFAGLQNSVPDTWP